MEKTEENTTIIDMGFLLYQVKFGKHARTHARTLRTILFFLLSFSGSVQRLFARKREEDHSS